MVGDETDFIKILFKILFKFFFLAAQGLSCNIGDL